MILESDYHRLWHQYDTEDKDELFLTKENMCHDMFYSTSDEEMKNLIQSEWTLQSVCRSFLMIYGNLDNSKLAYVQPYIENFKQSCKDRTAYFKKRFENTPSTVNRSRYALGCWFLTTEPKFLNEAVRLFVEFANNPTRSVNDRVDYLLTAFNLAKLYNLVNFNNGINDSAVSFFYQFAKTEPRWMMEPLEIFVKINKLADYNLINNMITNLHREAYQFFLKENPHLHQSLLEISLLLVALTNLDQQMKDKLRQIINTMIAESKINDGFKRWGKGEAIGAVWCFEQAKENYEKSGDRQKFNELLGNIRKATQDIQWKEFKMEITMPKLELTGNGSEELINSIYQYQEKIPNVDFIAQEAQRQLQANPLLNIVSHTVFSEKNPISHPSNNNEILHEKIKQLSTWNIRLGENRLSLVVKKLEDEKNISVTDFIKFFEGSEIVDLDQLAILKSGIENHFRNDYISSIHTLTPQIEGMLRRIFTKKGISLLKPKQDNIMDSELGSILRKDETVQVLGRDFANYLKIKYVDPTAINQRNEVSHALASKSVFSYPNSLSLIHDLMIMSMLS